MLEPEDNNNAVYTTIIKIDNRKLEWLEDDKSLELKCAEIYDNAGNYNESSLDTASGIRYYAPLEFDSMDFYYRASDNDMLAKDGDIIEIGFVSGHKVNIEDFIGFDKTGARFEWTEKKTMITGMSIRENIPSEILLKMTTNIFILKSALPTTPATDLCPIFQNPWGKYSITLLSATDFQAEL